MFHGCSHLCHHWAVTHLNMVDETGNTVYQLHLQLVRALKCIMSSTDPSFIHINGRSCNISFTLITWPPTLQPQSVTTTLLKPYFCPSTDCAFCWRACSGGWGLLFHSAPTHTLGWRWDTWAGSEFSIQILSFQDMIPVEARKRMLSCCTGTFWYHPDPLLLFRFLRFLKNSFRSHWPCQLSVSNFT